MITHEPFDGGVADSALTEVASLLSVCFEQTVAPDFIERVREKRRLHVLLARDGGELIGCKLGYERSRGVFYSWLGGVAPSHRRRGVARDLMRRQHAACAELGYGDVVTETTNAFRGMRILNLTEGFDIVGSYVNEHKELTLMLHKSLRKA